MVSRLIKWLNHESRGMNDAALLLGLFTFASQLLALVRDRLLATFVGAGPTLDVYYMAYKIPDFMYVSVATLASITVLLPYLSQKYGTGTHDEKSKAHIFFSQVTSVLLLFLLAVSIILFFIMPWLVRWIAPGFDVQQLATLTIVSRIMLIQPILIGLSNTFSSVTQMFRRFFISALSPVLYNVGIILGIVILYPLFGASGLAYGVLLGALLHLLVQLPVLGAHAFLPRFTLSFSWIEIRSMVLTSVPRTLGLAMSSLTALVLSSIASLLGSGSVSLFSLTNNMLNVPVGIVGISYSVASFPVLVKFFQGNNRSSFAEHIINAARKIIFWSVPITVLFIVLRAQIVRVILGTQSFSWDNTRLAAACLALFVIGLVALSLVHLLVRGYYAAGNTKKPLIMNFIGEVLTIVLAIVGIAALHRFDGIAQLFRDVLRLSGVVDVRILALPLAFSIGNIVNAILLWRVFRADFPESGIHSITRTFVQAVAASLCMGVVAYGALNIIVLIVNQNTFWGIFAQGLFAGILGIIIFVTIMIMLGNADMAEFTASLRRKFWKAGVVVDQMEVDK